MTCAWPHKADSTYSRARPKNHANADTTFLFFVLNLKQAVNTKFFPFLPVRTSQIFCPSRSIEKRTMTHPRWQIHTLVFLCLAKNFPATREWQYFFRIYPLPRTDSFWSALLLLQVLTTAAGLCFQQHCQCFCGTWCHLSTHLDPAPVVSGGSRSRMERLTQVHSAIQRSVHDHNLVRSASRLKVLKLTKLR